MLACLNKPSYKQAVGKIGLVGHSLLTTNLEHNLQINTNVVVQCFSVKTLLLITDHWKFKLELTINSLFPIKQEFGFDLLNIHQSLIFESNFTEYCGHYVLLGDMKLFTLSHANFFFFLHLTCLMLKLYLILRGWVKCLVLYIDIHLKKRGTKPTWFLRSFLNVSREPFGSPWVLEPVCFSAPFISRQTGKSVSSSLLLQ